jgi:integrase
MPIVAIRKDTDAESGKVVEANQKAIDALAFDSGTWRVEGVPGLYLRCRAKTKSFFIQRRVRGVLVKETLGPQSMKQARAAAMSTWSKMKPKAAGDAVTLAGALDLYLQDKALAEKTRHNYRYNAERYLGKWTVRSLQDIGADRAGVRALQRQITKDHGVATSNQVVRLISSVYRWARKEDTSLPECPTTAVEVQRIPARNWALSPQELTAWWYAEAEDRDKPGKVVKQGVSTLGPIKRMWWITALLTGARAGSIEALRWDDLALDQKKIRFRVTKGDRPYTVPLSDALAASLRAYRDSGAVPPSEWVFPSNTREGRHLVAVKNIREGVRPPHAMRHSFRTTLAVLGAAPDQSRLLMGHSMRGDVSRDYITESPLLIESLRPITNAVSEHYLKILGPVLD